MTTEIAPARLTELRSLGGDSLVEQLLKKFLESSPELLAQARVALKASDAARVDFCIHTLKGSALSIGLTDMGNLLTSLNARTKQQDLTGVEADLDRLNVMLEAVRAYKAKHFPA